MYVRYLVVLVSSLLILGTVLCLGFPPPLPPQPGSSSWPAGPLQAVIPWETLYEKMGGDTQVAVHLAPLRGLAQADSHARGQAIIQFHDNRVRVTVHGLAPESHGPYNVLLVHNRPGPGRSAVLERGPDGDTIIDLGPLTFQGASAHLDTQIAPERLRQFTIDLVVVTRTSPSEADTVILGGYTSVLHKLGRQVRLQAAPQRPLRPASSAAWWQRLGPPLAAANTSSTLEMQLQTLVADGRRLFFAETFNGNGRTCATCHRQERHFSWTRILSPPYLQTTRCLWQRPSQPWPNSKIARCYGPAA